jgi:AraC-like DNA-binding protein
VYQHYHEFFEVFYCLSGSCASTIEGERTVINAGTLGLISPGAVHTMEVFDDSLVINFMIRKSTFDKIFLNLIAADDILSHFFMSALFPPLSRQLLLFDTQGDEDLITQVFEMLCDQNITDRYSSRIMNNRLEIYFSTLMRKFGDKAVISTPCKSSESHWEIIAYITKHFRTVTLAQTAERFNLTPTYCSALIKKLSGHNFSDLVRDIRITRAKQLLASSNESIFDLSYSLGYDNQEIFIRAFKKIVGMTPGRWREENRGQG